MRLKKLIAGLISGVCLMTCSAFPLTVNADKTTGDEYQLNGLNPEDSPVNPTLSLSRLEIPISGAKKNPVQTVKLSLSGAEDKYNAVQLNLVYDERLEPLCDEYGDLNVKSGDALKWCSLKKVDKVAEDELFCIVASSDYGKDGVMWEIPFIIPDNVKVGDEFPISIMYKSRTNLYYSLFADSKTYNEPSGKLMEASLFTNGIENGYIKIIEDDVNNPVTTTAPITTTSTTTTTSVPVKGEKAIGAENYPLNGVNPEDSPVKPILALSRLEIPLSEAKKNPMQTVELSVSGSQDKYDSVGLHILFDERLELSCEKKGNRVLIETGDALKGSYTESYTVSENEVFCISASSHHCSDGVMWKYSFKLPDNIKAGDTFPIYIKYANKVSEVDCFGYYNAWVFTNGIVHGYIKIVDDEEGNTTSTTTSTTTTTTTSTTTTAKPTTTTTTSTTTTAKPTTTTTTSTTTTAKPTTTTTTSTTTTAKLTTTTTTSTTTTAKPTTTTTTSTTTTAKPTTTTTSTTSTSSTTSTTTVPVTTTVPEETVYDLGDVNGDDKINAVDASVVLTYYAMISTNKNGDFNEGQKTAGDVNRDGLINAVDASCILSYYAYTSTTKDKIICLEDFFKK